MSEIEILIRSTKRLTGLMIIIIIILITTAILHFGVSMRRFSAEPSTMPSYDEGTLIAYGRELIEHTSLFLGPRGTVRRISNGMNCQNCHLEGGTKAFSANFIATAATYPKFRKRSGIVESLHKRINDCLERSLNGKALAVDTREMQAMIAYIKSLGLNAKAGSEVVGAGLISLPLLERPASPDAGKGVYVKRCVVCHGAEGEGKRDKDNGEWLYPPLWGPNSYNTGAGLFRISKFAAFVKANMPYGASHRSPVLSDEEAWDVAAYVNSMPRPHRLFAGDWPDVSSKPMDYPFGPYADPYPETQHKFGPFGPIVSNRRGQ